MTNLDSILKITDVTLSAKVRLVKAMIFPVVIYGCESWPIKKAEHRRIDAFELWGWRRLLSPLDCTEIKPVNPKGNQSWIFSGRTDAEAETLNTLATWFEELTHWKRLWCWERLKAGEGDDRGGDGWMASPTQWTWIWVNSGSWWLTGQPGALLSMPLQSWTWQNNWTEYSKKGHTQQHFPCFKWAQWSFKSNIWLVEPWKNWYF